jgi:5-methyltetrahydrofolate--homocysteine methyltransferase
MIIIGEKLNSSIPKTLNALKNHDEGYIIRLIKKQASADYIDINTALNGENETENMLWLIQLVVEHSSCGLMLDSPNLNVFARCLRHTQGRRCIINSITADEKYEEVIDLAKEYGTGLVCLPMKGSTIPSLPEERLENAAELVQKLRKAGIGDPDIYMDVLAEAAATNDQAAAVTIKTIRLVKKHFPQIKTICGLSNISYGLPGRVNMNAVFLAMVLQAGLDSAIVDITNEAIRYTIFAANALLGKDEYCMAYIGYMRGM